MTCQWPGNLTVADAVPCGPTNSTFPVVPCCGARDQCMTDNLCRYSRSRIGGSGYYIAGCTASDEGAFDDASGSLANVCVNRCCMLSIYLSYYLILKKPFLARADVSDVLAANKRYPDAIYTPEKSQWSCCGGGKNGSRGCDNPTDWTFPAAAPASLVSYGPNLNTNSQSSSGLSTGAKAGIGVGVGVGGLIIIAAVVFGVLFLRRRKRNTSPAVHQDGEGGGVVEDAKKQYSGPVHKNPTSPAELAQDGPVVQELPAGHRSVPQELPAGRDIQELPGDNNWAR